jgi:hypothetical protein
VNTIDKFFKTLGGERIIERRSLRKFAKFVKIVDGSRGSASFAEWLWKLDRLMFAGTISIGDKRNGDRIIFDCAATEDAGSFPRRAAARIEELQE